MNNFKVKKKPADTLDNQLKVWEKSIDVQMHFNELQMKIRNFSVLVISALVGAAGIALKDRVIVDHTFLLMHFQGSLSALFLGAAAVAWLAFFFMDHFWYYPLLLGAVKHAAEIESSLEEKVPLIGLTTRIGKESPQAIIIKVGNKTLLNRTLHSKDKSFVFYIAVFILLLVLAVGSSWIPAAEKGQSSAAPQSPVTEINKYNPAKAATQAVPPSSPSQGTTVILNQDFYNGEAPRTNTKTATRSKERDAKNISEKSKMATERCAAAEPVCKGDKTES